MPDPLRLTRADARRIAVRAQLLTADRPRDVVDTVRHLAVVQAEPTSAIAPSADLVLWSRLGPSYDVATLREALDEQVLIEHHGFIRPTSDMALFQAEMAAWPGAGALKDWEVARAEWVEANSGCHRDLLDRLRRDGPLPTGELPDSCEVPWRSSGWNNARNVQMLLMLMVSRGEVACVGREGREQLWDLADRVYPDDPYPDVEEARLLRDRRRLAALGIARPKAAASPGEQHDVGTAGVPAVVEGVRGTWRVDPALADLVGADLAGRAALLSPFDRLVQDRKRLTEVFEFDYLLEMYKPASRRRWGYYALPILCGDRLIGKLDASADRAEGALVVRAVHEDEPFPRHVAAAVDAEIGALAEWLDLDLVRLDRAPA
ncbi:crosslink repair DNA glycosylase YcaQ family protein [Nocardioides sp. YIM 152315]|uniref:DNA glycosylase AlkZ-like family protein n=1 Tax=Nocardioides sp. YIM 152315 TaxID=3031760 RepID=UPI0023D9B7EB|nr:crosslink repair DNA glycosylase YcaQ family protein [Nocardioides sp. YIM 152315]MDF1601929.1 crosslink repair DNA glycosylase YcaQ family protein [Nocardioides sp. YIM 152315]